MHMKKSNETSTVHTGIKAGEELREVAGTPTKGPDGFFSVQWEVTRGFLTGL